MSPGGRGRGPVGTPSGDRLAKADLALKLPGGAGRIYWPAADLVLRRAWLGRQAERAWFS